MTNNVWLCGIPGSRWSGIDIQMRSILPCDRTDETAERTMYHRAYNPDDANNGHRGSYWGPGMGCGEDWIDFNYLSKHKLTDDINKVFHQIQESVILFNMPLTAASFLFPVLFPVKPMYFL